MRFFGPKLVSVIILMSTVIFTLTIYNEPYDHLKQFVNNKVSERFFENQLCACPDRCLAAMNHDFKERFRKDISPVLSLNNSELSQEINTWWQHLQSSRSKAKYQQVIKELFAVIPGEGHYKDAGPHRCRTCAVVGNSGNLLDSHYGPLIDFNDFVIRMNKAPVEGFEDDVGWKTTHRVMYPESAVHLDNSTHLVLLPFKMLDIQWVTSALTNGTIKRTRFKVIDKLQANKDKTMVMHPAFLYYVHTTWLHIKARSSYPSTGFLALMFALHICDEVNVFGFGSNNKGTWHHYFEESPKRFKGTGHHSGGIETTMIKEMRKRKIITQYTGW
ncbi:CMP-N-acetylneuraminate-beta-galactosamide-alpha-2,3-sialyltransferase 1-like [Triplophysa dalaica]|uniref:CMP-N-acetylneuraminate-beta-galactosamide- alpha-2,3-sialyltransferase 1-like n=1 Tax=Triplophysa dalaica TaxID=1582913 RepID=UPI0024E0093C|nr:CMP-N-acetylneuraminate-beta-galactosamide-alpha-2,3-sialyltransferase 1-like [Triplophysa dalaica]XP_056597752.1 CMP-N-acetylneuraminate-beta-galactosamide-alpha-2,3-sialyltransferase 1-like [Triplophysa dalaica]